MPFALCQMLSSFRFVLFDIGCFALLFFSFSFQFFFVPILGRKGISVFRYFGISVFRYFGISVFRYFGISVFRYFGISVFRYE
jgi:hypothetical protein